MRKCLGMVLLLVLLAGCGDDGKPPDGDGKNGNGGDGNVIDWDEKPRVLIEAESATKVVAPFKVAADADASGGKYLTLPSGGCSGGHHTHIAPEGDPRRTAGSAALEFTVEKKGKYVLWMRKWWCCSCGDSFHVRIDGGKAFTFGNDGTTPRHWSWWAHKDAGGKVKFELSAGKHKVLLTNRGESGFRVDQILLALDPKYVPQGKEKPPTGPPKGRAGR